MIDSYSIFLLVCTFAAVAGLILLVAVFKLNPFLSLFLASLSIAIAAGMPLSTVIHSFEAGVGGTLGHIAIVVALGTMLGKMMAESGGATAIANSLIRWFGEKRVPWAMMLIGFVIGLPVFFEVGFVLLIPIAFTVARRTRTSLILVCLPLAAGTIRRAWIGAAASRGAAGHYHLPRGCGPDHLYGRDCGAAHCR